MPFCPVEQNHLCNIGNGHMHHVDQFFEIILNLDKVQEEMFVSRALVDAFILPSGTICAILEAAITRNNSVQSF